MLFEDLMRFPQVNTDKKIFFCFFHRREKRRNFVDFFLSLYFRKKSKYLKQIFLVKIDCPKRASSSIHFLWWKMCICRCKPFHQMFITFIEPFHYTRLADLYMAIFKDHNYFLGRIRMHKCFFKGSGFF